MRVESGSRTGFFDVIRYAVPVTPLPPPLRDFVLNMLLPGTQRPLMGGGVSGEAGPPGVGCHLFQPPCMPGIAPVARVTAATQKGWPLFLIGVVPGLPSEVQFSVAVHSQVHVSVTAARCQTSVSEGLT